MKKIGMIVAVEIDSVLKQYGTPGKTLEYKGYTVWTYTNEDYELYVLNCGAGEISAAAGTQFLISVLNVEMIVNFGVVGGLTQEMAEARTCVVERVVHYDFDTSELDHCEVGRYMNYPSVYIPAPMHLIEKAQAVCPELKRVTCASGDKFVGDPEKKRALHTQYGADICEMEAAGILLTCNRNEVPVLMIKTVSDGIEGGAEAFTREIERTSRLCVQVADKIIREL